MTTASWESVRLCAALVLPVLGASPRVLEVGHDDGCLTALPESALYERVAPKGLVSLPPTYDLVFTTDVRSADQAGRSVFQSMAEAAGPTGVVVLVAPSRAVEGDAPFTPAVVSSWAAAVGWQVVAHWTDARGPRNDLVVILSREPLTLPERPVWPSAVAPRAPRGAPAVETWKGAFPYLEVLAGLHHELGPRSYLEIGVHRGLSLRLASCPAVAVDPDPRVSARSPNVRFFNESSDDFFRYDAPTTLTDDLDLVFIDGMHLFEYALRDFMHVERYSHAGTMVVLDDVLPNHPVQARRERASMAWCGDVWKIIPCLTEYRPDLTLVELDTAPTGLLLVSGLQAGDDTLWTHYDEIMTRYVIDGITEPPRQLLQREEARSPAEPEVADLVRASVMLRNA